MAAPQPAGLRPGCLLQNYEVWQRQEPAYLKYWLRHPATRTTSPALDREEGFRQDFLPATITAFLEQCGVTTQRWQQSAAYFQPELVSEQCTLRRKRKGDLPVSAPGRQPASFQLDLCPSGSVTSCY